MRDFERADEFDDQPTDTPERTGRVLDVLKRIGKGAGGLAIAAVGVTLSYIGGEWMVSDAVAHLQEAQEQSEEFYWATGLVMGALVSTAAAVGSIIGGGAIVKDSITG